MLQLQQHILDFYALEWACLAHLWFHHITWADNISSTLVRLCWFSFITFWFMVGCWRKCTFGLNAMAWILVDKLLHINLLNMNLGFVSGYKCEVLCTCVFREKNIVNTCWSACGARVVMNYTCVSHSSQIKI